MRPLAWLAPLVPIYRAALFGKNAAYDHGLRKPLHLLAPVVSIGNLSTGGGGKTPFVIALAELLVHAGIAIDVLSRGHGRAGNAVERVDPNGSAEKFGDEPILIARQSNVPVYVGSERYAAGLRAEQDALRLHLLDDGFQHRQLARDLDIVLMHRDDLRSRLLPAGHLREPLSSLRRVGIVVLRDEDRDLGPLLRRYMDASASIWHVERRIAVNSRPGQAIAFGGIARPEEFFSTLRSHGAEMAETIAFPDHHRYTVADLARLCRQAKLAGATRFLTTEKDGARLSATDLAMLEQCAPVETVPLHVRLIEPEEAVTLIRGLQSR